MSEDEGNLSTTEQIYCYYALTKISLFQFGKFG